MVHRWDTLTFLHWRFEPEVVQRLLPGGLTAETIDGAAWVGLVPFLMRVRLLHATSLPWASRFCETNVRTYVRDRTGRSGIWFFSLDAARLGAVVVARMTYRLPYYWSTMRLQQDGSRVRYQCRRRWPGNEHPSSHAVVDVGAPYEPEELSELDHFLTARFVLFSATRRRQRFAMAQHDELVEAAGLPHPAVEPVVHYSPGVEVRIGRPDGDQFAVAP
jgi:uncharacterized protein YqjF (DUF2071 family)